MSCNAQRVDLTSREEAEHKIRASFPREVAACEELLNFAVRNVLETWNGRPIDGAADELLGAEIARGTKTFRASFDLCLGGFGPQSAMLNRSLFEGMAVAHWISANPEIAIERFARHERYSGIIWRERLSSRGWQDPDDDADALSDEERGRFVTEFGRRAERPWYGISNSKKLVEAIEHMWPEGAPRTDLWDFYSVPQADNNLSLHSSSRAYVTAVVARQPTMLTLDAGPSVVQVKRGLLGAFWSFAQLLGLMLDHFDSPARPEMDAFYPRARAAFWDVDPAVLRKTGRNDPCPCGSGVKFKKCHGVPPPASV